MSPCMKTSRIKQAISSTQLFIQRVLLNLEAGVDPLIYQLGTMVMDEALQNVGTQQKGFHVA